MGFKSNDPASRAIQSKGGRVGGPARAAKLSPERRREIARLASRARWGRKIAVVAPSDPPEAA